MTESCSRMEPPPVSLQRHRTQNTSSKLPSFRPIDVVKPSRLLAYNARTEHSPAQNNATPTIPKNPQDKKDVKREHSHSRNHSEAVANKPVPPALQPRPVTSPGGLPNQFLDNSSSLLPSQPQSAREKVTRSVPAKHSGNNGYLGQGPPIAMITQRSFQAVEIENPTKDWVVNQSALTATSPIDDRKPLPAEPQEKPVTPLIPPIRGFKSSRQSVEINATSPRLASMDQDDTLRALDGYNTQRVSRRDQEEQSSDDSDLFLKLAREESAGTTRGPIRRSQINRQSLPPNHTVFQSSLSRRRGSNQESSSGARSGEEQMSQALTYRPSTRERVPTAMDMSRSRYYGGASHSTPTTPRTYGGSREISPESQTSYGGRRPSVPDQGLPARTPSYRQSNLSYSTPRTYNSSPLVSRTMDVNDTPEALRPAEGTESTVSTTAASTVWDELEDLKSRIHRLELTGKLPPTSGAAVSRASNDRPPTATTTVTTMSLSPKRGRGNSISPVDSNSVEAAPNDAHPLLSSALAKSKALLSPEVFKALEATAADALAIASMMGSSGQPGPISSSQSTVGGLQGPSTVSDRQVRRKADSMCRSLTELCLALSEGKSEQTQPKKNLSRPGSRDAENGNAVDNTQRQPLSTDLARIKSSPRALSRLEARRSSLLATSSLPSPRYTPSEAGTPTQSSMAGRRTSLLLRSRRGGTEEPEEEDESRFRAPSRAATEVGRIRNSPREYISQQPLPDNRIAAVQSSLPVRRHFVSTSLTNTGASGPSSLPAISNIGGRRYLDRSTPERDTTGVAGRLAEDRGQRISSIGQIGQGLPLGRTVSLTRRTRQPSSMDASTAGHGGVFQ